MKYNNINELDKKNQEYKNRNDFSAKTFPVLEKVKDFLVVQDQSPHHVCGSWPPCKIFSYVDILKNATNLKLIKNKKK